MRISFLLALIFYQCNFILSQAVFNQSEVINQIRVFPDLIHKHIYYFTPGTLDIEHAVNGKPEVRLTMIRYTGTALTGDQGKFRFNNCIQFKIKLKSIPENTVLSIQQILTKRYKFQIQLMPIELSSIQSSVVFSSTVSELGSEKKFAVDAIDQEGDEGKDGLWESRIFTLRLSNEDAQLIQKTIEKGQSHIGFSYALKSNGVDVNFIEGNFNKSMIDSNLLGKQKNQISKMDSSIIDKKDYTIFSDAFNIHLDNNKYPELIRKIDLNAERIPMGFPFLEVRCYAFSKYAKNYSLIQRKVEFEATSVNKNNHVRHVVIFTKNNVDINVQTLKFKYAIRSDHPIRYRIIDIHDNSPIPKVGEWFTIRNLNAVLDVSKI